MPMQIGGLGMFFEQKNAPGFPEALKSRSEVNAC